MIVFFFLFSVVLLSYSFEYFTIESIAMTKSKLISLAFFFVLFCFEMTDNVEPLG